MNIFKPIFNLTKFERGLWLFSVISVTSSFFFSDGKEVLSLISSIIGVTSLIFIAKGAALGQIMTIIFSILYALISIKLRYYGEMITYMFMTAPIAALSVFSWLRNPYDKEKNEVRVAKISKKQIVIMCLLTIIVTAVFYFFLKFLGNASLNISTVSIATSFLASYLQFIRSPYYALAYALNDTVLIVLWIIASIKSLSHLPMVVCFVMFFLNDIYGFFNWKKMMKKQSPTKS